MSILGDGIIDLKVGTASLRKGLSAVSATMSSALGTIRNIIKRGMQAAMIGLTAAFAAAIGGIYAAINQASDFQEISSKFKTVFGELSETAEEWIQELAKTIGRSKSEIMGFMAGLQDTFVPFGFARDQAMGLSQQVTQLGIDLASFNNMSDSEAIDLLTSALIGNHEAVRRFGVLITAATLEEELLRMGIAGGSKAATEQQKVMARLNLIMRMTKDAQGDAARTSDSYANRMKALRAAINTAAVAIGEKFLPIATAIVNKLITLVPVIQQNILSVLHWGAALWKMAEPVRDVLLGAFGTAFQFLRKGFIAITVIVKNWRQSLRVVLLAAAVRFMELVDGIRHHFTNGIPNIMVWFLENWRTFFEVLWNAAKNTIDYLTELFAQLFASIYHFMTTGEWSWNEVLTDPLKQAVDETKELFKDMGEAYAEGFEESDITKKLRENLHEVTGELGKAIADELGELEVAPDLSGVVGGNLLETTPDMSAPGTAIAEKQQQQSEQAARDERGGRTGLADMKKQLQDAQLGRKVQESQLSEAKAQTSILERIKESLAGGGNETTITTTGPHGAQVPVLA